LDKNIFIISIIVREKYLQNFFIHFSILLFPLKDLIITNRDDSNVIVVIIINKKILLFLIVQILVYTVSFFLVCKGWGRRVEWSIKQSVEIKQMLKKVQDCKKQL